MDKLKFYCVTNKKIDFLNKKNYHLCWVGNDNPPVDYIRCDNKINIFDKEKYYSELTFHYWYWKNLLPYEKAEWIGFCQKRRYWIKSHTDKQKINLSNLNNFLIDEPESDWNSYQSILCDPINLTGAKKIKIIKRGWRNILEKPSLLFKKNFETIKIHFDMHHGYKNLDKAISVLDEQDKNDFYNYVNYETSYNPHIMFITKPDIAFKWFNTLFSWLERCEEIFGFENLKGYDTTRLYAYLAERYLSFWFNKYTKTKNSPWTFVDISKN